jgi:hypothetical protein
MCEPTLFLDDRHRWRMMIPTCFQIDECGEGLSFILVKFTLLQYIP